MKKSFAENCIRYISTATALILALAMLCCANFSASAKNLGSNLTITDTTSLLEDINTTTNTTPAKTKDLIASGAGVNVEVVSTSNSFTNGTTIYFDITKKTDWNSAEANICAIFYYQSNDNLCYETSNDSYSDSNINKKTKFSSSSVYHTCTKVEDNIYSVTVPESSLGSVRFLRIGSDGTALWNYSKRMAVDQMSTNNCVKISDWDNTGEWSTYSGGSSGGSSGTTPTTIYYNNSSTKWSKVYAYCWDKDNKENVAWPGAEMTSVGNNIYSYVLPTDKAYVSCIFNNGSGGDGNQTGDLTIPTGGKNYYNGSSWSTLYTVTFNNNGYGTEPATQYVVSEGTATDPGTLTAEGQTFGGWYTDEGLTANATFPYTVTSNVTFYAKWTAIESTVTLDANGGEVSPTSITVVYDGTYSELPTPTRTGHDFDGWFTAKTDGTKVNLTDMVKITSNTNLYAHWTAKTYSITYKSGSETLSGLEPTTYTYGDGATLPTPDKNGYTFKGWYANEDLTGDPVTSIPADATEDKTFYAKWELKVFKHQYVFLDVSDKDWFYAGSCVGVVSFNGGTTYEKMNELFTDSSSYKTDVSKSNLLFVKVPENTTTITFARNNTENGEVKYHNLATYKYDNNNGYNFGENNLLKLDSAKGTLSGSWSTVDYTPVPVSVTHNANGTVVASKTLADDTTTITVKNDETKYFASSTTGISVAVTPATDYQISSFKIVNDGEDIKSVFENFETGGTYDLGTLSAKEYDIQATFEEVPKENPTVTIENIPNSTISFKYTDPAGTVKTATASGDYVVQYKSNISLVISSNPGYHLASITGLKTESTLPIAGDVTATKTQVKENLTVSYTLAPDPKVTVICCDTNGTPLGAEKVTLKFGETVIDNGKTNTVSYNNDTGNTFTATIKNGNEYHLSGFYTQRPTADTPVSDENKITTERSTADYIVSASYDPSNELTVKNVKNNVTFYAVFSQLYEVKFIFSNLEKFSINGNDKIDDKPIKSGYSVYVGKDANLALKATVGDDYQLKKSSWTFTDNNGVFTFNNDSAEDVTYKVAGNSVITITPQIATYTGEGKWGSKLLRIDTSNVNGDEPWFAAKFATDSSGTTYTWVRFNKISDSSYECVVPDGYNYVKFCRMAKKATTFTDKTTNDINATTAWNVTDNFISLGNTSSEYTLAFVNEQTDKITATKKTNN